MLLLSLGAGVTWLAAELYRLAVDAPLTRPDTGGFKVMRFHTVLTEGVNVRGRVNGRLYSLEVWREHV